MSFDVSVVCVSVISRERRKSKIADICNTFDELFWYLLKKMLLIFLIFALRGKT